MSKKNLLLVVSIVVSQKIISQPIPTFGPEIPVTINGLTFDAMEPSISADGNHIFFNSINNGTTTSLFYATRVNDTTFTFSGALSGANQIVNPRLDAVASSDSANHFFWVSTRNYPNQFDNYFHGTFNGSNITNISRVHGTFYINSPGWLIMDAAINYTGNLLYFCNAHFNNCGPIPCEAKLGVAQKQNDSTFNKLSNSDVLMQYINDTSYVVYAPFITKNGMELYFTRILKSNLTQSEICVSYRTDLTSPFSPPIIIYASPLIPEAPTLTTDQSKMYYHKKAGSLYKLFLRIRTYTSRIEESMDMEGVSIFPNPSTNTVHIIFSKPTTHYSIEIYSLVGQQVMKIDDKGIIDISNLESGVYTLTLKQENKSWKTRLVKE